MSRVSDSDQVDGGAKKVATGQADGQVAVIR